MKKQSKPRPRKTPKTTASKRKVNASLSASKPMDLDAAATLRELVLAETFAASARMMTDNVLGNMLDLDLSNRDSRATSPSRMTMADCLDGAYREPTRRHGTCFVSDLFQFGPFNPGFNVERVVGKAWETVRASGHDAILRSANLSESRIKAMLDGVAQTAYAMERSPLFAGMERMPFRDTLLRLRPARHALLIADEGRGILRLGMLGTMLQEASARAAEVATALQGSTVALREADAVRLLLGGVHDDQSMTVCLLAWTDKSLHAAIGKRVSDFNHMGRELRETWLAGHEALWDAPMARLFRHISRDPVGTWNLSISDDNETVCPSWRERTNLFGDCVFGPFFDVELPCAPYVDPNIDEIWLTNVMDAEISSSDVNDIINDGWRGVVVIRKTGTSRADACALVIQADGTVHPMDVDTGKCIQEGLQYRGDNARFQEEDEVVFMTPSDMLGDILV